MINIFVLAYDPNIALDGVRKLLKFSKIHQHWTEEDILRLIVPAIHYQQALVWFDTITQEPVAYASWAWLSEEKSRGFVSNSYRIQPEDFPHGINPGIKEDLWILDFISPFGGTRTYARELYKYLMETTNDPCAFIKRSKQFGKTERLGIFLRRSALVKENKENDKNPS